MRIRKKQLIRQIAVLFMTCVLCICIDIGFENRAVPVQAESKKSFGAVLKRVSFKKKYTVYTGKTKRVKVKYRAGAKQKQIVWKSSNPAVAQVKPAGSGKTCRIKAAASGKTIITCWPKGKSGKKLTCTVTVKTRCPRIKALTVSEKKIYVYIGDKVQNKLTVKPVGAKQR